MARRGYLSSLEDDADLYLALQQSRNSLAVESSRITESAAVQQIPPRVNALQPAPSLDQSHQVYASSNSNPTNDPRSSSTDSLHPEPTGPSDRRRKLLMVYIHGFMGNETSFQQFPAHVHNLLVITLAGSHVVHTKIYPRYKSRKQIQYATEDFSKWLTPHEGPNTDVVLLGHSMGGLVAAEVVLLPPTSPSDPRAFRHRILGVINFDVPFLGLHPGIVSSGLASLFRGKDDAPGKTVLTNNDSEAGLSNTSLSSSTLTLSSEDSADSSLHPSRQNTLLSPPSDPNYNPDYSNDIKIPIRKGRDSLMHFFNKHSKDLRTAAKQYVKSHLEFGGAMADYKGLKARYERIRALEETDAAKRQVALASSRRSNVPRVRFANYYTASTGRPKKAKIPSPTQSPIDSPRTSQASLIHDGERSPADSGNSTSLTTSTAGGVDHVENDEKSLSGATNVTDFDLDQFDLPPVPPEPIQPRNFDPSRYHNEDVRKVARRTHEREMKAWRQAVEDRHEAIAEREMLLESIRQRNVMPNPKSLRSGDDSTLEILSNTSQHDKSIPAPSTALTLASPPQEQPLPSISSTPTAAPPQPPLTQPQLESQPSTEDSKPPDAKKPKKDRKFCMLPPKDAKGNRDPTWVRVKMEGVDEVGAHCGLFFVGETYEMLVGDTAARVESWVLSG